MQEQLVSFETAKLAKEKGFSIPKCKNIFVWEKRIGNVEATVLEFKGNYKNKTLIECDKNWQQHYMRPTQSLLQKWLREVHGINIFMTFKPNIKKWDFIPYSMGMNAKEYIEYNSNYTKQNNERRFDTYEEALEVGLQEALKLIQK